MATKASGFPPVWRVAALSRVAMLLLMLTFDALVDDYDTSGRLSPGDGVSSAKTSVDAERPPSPLCAAVEGLVTWDAVYFLRIAEVGYEHEQTHAFFPLLPAVTRGVAATSSALAGAVASGSDSKTMWRRVRRRLTQTPSRCATALAAVAVSNAAHVFAAVILERLGELVLAEQRIGRDSLLHEVDHSAAHSEAARAAAVLFALNPASVFHSAAYTESVFALFSFAGFYLLERARSAGTGTATKKSAFWNRNGAAVCFALACATRSNGALNGLVLAHDFFFAAAVPFWKEKKKKKRVFFFVAATSAFAARCVATLFPLFAVQLYGYRTYCVDGWKNGDSKPAWCDVWRPFPNVYAHVQSHYWNVGFLRYYESKQIPNFLLAAPALFASANAFLSWWNAVRRARFGNERDESAKRSSDDDEAGEADEARASRTRVTSGSSVSRRRRGGQKKTKNLSRDFALDADVDEDAWMLSPRVRPYLFKWAVMSAVALLAMHVQVTTRFLSVTPGVYWFLAKKGFAEAETERRARTKKSAAGHEKKKKTFWRRGVTTYSTSFFLLGALLFPTFYPWT
jgi:phosphatidylinositol glycan class V